MFKGGKRMHIDAQKEGLAPIILFVYNRLDHTKTVVEALKRCPESKASELYIYSDAAKDGQSVAVVKEVRQYIKSIDGFSKINIIEREYNWGIEKSEIDAITTVINKHGKAIMIEDDIVVSGQFLKFVNLALTKYKNILSVGSVTGYSFIDDSDTTGLPETAFIQLASAWGWATWSDRWKLMHKSIEKQDIVRLCKRQYREKFDFGYHYSDMVYKQFINKKITWDVLWYYTLFENGMFTMIPTKTMVNNIGMDGSGVHYSSSTAQNRIEDIDKVYFSGELDDNPKENLDVNYILKRTLNRMSYYPTGKIELFRWKIKENIKWFLRKIKLEL